jgi:long-chain acyl-CoA synthetase
VEPSGRTTTYGELHRRANQVSHALRAAGLVTADNVAIVSSNTARFFEVALGCAQVGVRHVPVNYHLTAPEVAYVVENSGSKLVFADERFLSLVREALDTIDYPVQARIALDEGDGFTGFADFIADHSEEEPGDRVHAPVMLYTSGTTGRPKGVNWPMSRTDPETAAAFMDPLMALRGMSHDDAGVTLIAGPLYHGAPGSWGLQGLHHGHRVVLMDRWDSEEFLRLVQDHGVTTAQLAPIHFNRLLQLPEDVRNRYDTSSLKVVSHAGAATPVPVKQAMIDWWGPVLWEYYASSEGYGTSITPQEWLAHPGSVGRHDGNGASMKILDDEGHELPPGEVGILWIRNPGGVNSEYLDDPEKTAESRSGDHYTAGDMAYIDADGWLYIVDRRVDLILSGGVNIYPAEVENALLGHPAVLDVAVIGAPDEEWGQSVHALIVPAPGHETGPDLTTEILTHAAATLAKFKIPRVVEFRDGLPYSDTGKLLRRQLRDELWAGERTMTNHG